MKIPNESESLAGRATPILTSDFHAVKSQNLMPPFPEEIKSLVVGMGCFWGAERIFWEIPEVWSTAVGYCGGHTLNPTYEEICSGLTGHAEVVLVLFNEEKISLSKLFKVFWENHDPTQGMRQGNDVGTQYRSGIWVSGEDQRTQAEVTRNAYGVLLRESGYGDITTEVEDLSAFFYAEDYHQQYLHKNPHGYCGIGGTGVTA